MTLHQLLVWTPHIINGVIAGATLVGAWSAYLTVLRIERRLGNGLGLHLTVSAEGYQVHQSGEADTPTPKPRQH